MSAHDPVRRERGGGRGGENPRRVCDDVLEKGAHKCRHAIIRQTCGRDDSFETTEAVKTEGPFLTFSRRTGGEETGRWCRLAYRTWVPHPFRALPNNPAHIQGKCVFVSTATLQIFTLSFRFKCLVDDYRGELREDCALTLPYESLCHSLQDKWKSVKINQSS